LLLRLRVTVCRHYSHRLFDIDSAYLFQDRDPIEFRHVQIKQNHIRVFLVIKLEAFPTAALQVWFWLPVVEQVREHLLSCADQHTFGPAGDRY